MSRHIVELNRAHLKFSVYGVKAHLSRIINQMGHLTTEHEKIELDTALAYLKTVEERMRSEAKQNKTHKKL